MTDRELLELAAMAAGLEYHIDHLDGTPKLIVNGSAWNPIVYDGDALRLAVKLHIGIEFWSASVRGIALTSTAVQPIEGGDELAATRRAIVSAAAEIGRSA